MEVDVWQASPVGLYENQDPNQAEMNLRGRFHTHEDGRFWFRPVKPAGYPVPTHGPTGDLLRAAPPPLPPGASACARLQTRLWTLITQVFVDDDEHLQSDVVFGVTRPSSATTAAMTRSRRRRRRTSRRPGTRSTTASSCDRARPSGPCPRSSRRQGPWHIPPTAGLRSSSAALAASARRLAASMPTPGLPDAGHFALPADVVETRVRRLITGRDLAMAAC